MGIFDDQVDVFAIYAAEIHYRDKIIGGVPMNQEIIEGWLRTKMGITDEMELMALVQQTLEEVEPIGGDEGGEADPLNFMSDMTELSRVIARKKLGNGFKSDEEGIYIESRTIKAMLKEVTNIRFAGDRWKAPNQKTAGKGPKNFMAERVFINPDKIHLCRYDDNENLYYLQEPDGLELSIGHIVGPQGPRSTLSYNAFAERPIIAFEVMVADDAIPLDHWQELWVHAQENGHGAARSQGYGRFDLMRWDRVR